MRVTVTGATGLIGRELARALRGRGDQVVVLSRSAEKGRELLGAGFEMHEWSSPKDAPPPAEALAPADAVVNLLGEPIAQRWTDEVKREIAESRVLSTRSLVSGMNALGSEGPRVLVSQSATGYYGAHGDEQLDEHASPGDDFLAGVTVAWEREAQGVRHASRVALARTGVVLSPSGGALEKLLPPFKLGVGGPVAGGKQYVPWIHLDDVVGALVHCIDSAEASEAVNLTAPRPGDQRGAVAHARTGPSPAGDAPGPRAGAQAPVRRDGLDRAHRPARCPAQVARVGLRVRIFRDRPSAAPGPGSLVTRFRVEREMVSIVWYARRDLRVHDHPALAAAAAGAERRCRSSASTTLLHGRHASGPARSSCSSASRDLDAALRERGSGLVVRQGPPERELAALVARDSERTAVHFSADVTPFATRRDERVPSALERGRRRAAAASRAVRPSTTRRARARRRASRTRSSRRSTARGAAARAGACSAPRARCRRCRRAGARARIPSLARSACAGGRRARPPGGEHAARAALTPFLAGDVAHYGDEPRRARRRRDLAALALPALRLHLAARARGRACRGGAGAEAFRRQLCWRDFYAHVLLHFPATRTRSSRSATAARFAGARAEALRGLVRGPDGLPARRRRHAPAAPRGLDAQPRAAGRRLVPDQGPRHRLALGRALVHAPAARRRRGQQQRQLAVDRLGRRRPAAVFRRIFNPARQQERSIPTAPTCAATCPSCATCPTSTCAEPWTMPEDVQRAAGCVIGSDYPEPIVDHAQARRRRSRATRRHAPRWLIPPPRGGRGDPGDQPSSPARFRNGRRGYHNAAER